ncbi:MAG TPA: ABC transporter permease, partial [Verrucomicrobiae bacterium]|nr:ABC transporter permease [Verrucomicrobiae bacterium]
MTFLPLVTRELRAASRRKSTYRIRGWISVTAFVVGLFFIAIGMLGSRDAGQVLFSFLTTFAVIFALLAGIFFTPDCIS